MERLLRFAVEHDRVIRLMFMRDGRLFQVNAHIVSYDDKQVSFVTTRSPRRRSSAARSCLRWISAAGMMGKLCNLVAQDCIRRRGFASAAAIPPASNKSKLLIHQHQHESC